MLVTMALLAGVALAAVADDQIPASVLAGPAPGNYGIGGTPALAAAVRSTPSQSLPASQQGGGAGGRDGAAVFSVAGGGQGPQEVLRLKDAYALLEGTVWVNGVPYDFSPVDAAWASEVARLLAQSTADAVETETGTFWQFFDAAGNAYSMNLFAHEYIGGTLGISINVAVCAHQSDECRYCEMAPAR